MSSSKLYAGEPNGAASVFDLRLSRFGEPEKVTPGGWTLYL
jgi:hypothetical protein